MGAKTSMDVNNGPSLMDGVVIMDLAMQLIAFDRGAAAILRNTETPRNSPERELSLPEEVLKVLTNCEQSDLPSLRTHFWIGKNGYVCRAYLIEPFTGSAAAPMVALHLQRDSSTMDAIYRIAAEYHLTDREKEALTGISMGLTCKEIAERMNISPNTVKAFLRLIMIKMGVTRRAEIIVKILENNGTNERLGLSIVREIR